MLRKLQTKIANLIKQGQVSRVGSDNDPFPNSHLTSNDKESKYIPITPYGLFSNAPENSHVLMWNLQGRESNKFGIVNDYLNRKKGLKEGEITLFNTLTGDYLIFKEKDGGIGLKTSYDLVAEVDGDLNAAVGGATTIDSTGNLELKAPLIKLTGPVECSSTIKAVGNISSEADVIADSAGTPITLLQHFHLGNLGFNTGIALAIGGGVAPPSNLPSVIGNDIVDGNGTKSTLHTHGGVEPGGGSTGTAT